VIAARVAGKVAGGACRFGIVIDGAGIGSAMAANKVPGVRAALCYDVSSANNAREHNDANVLSLGARLIGTALAEQIAETFLSTDCTEERHRRRVAMIDALEAGEACPACASTAAPHFGLAHADRAADNPALGSPEGATFRASAARWLSKDAMDNVGADDLERVARRIFELFASGEERGNLFCFGDVCVDTSVAVACRTASARRWRRTSPATSITRCSSRMRRVHRSSSSAPRRASTASPRSA
jgi:RpiB/LacA/LacB family sugar-phosphate isomerase